MSHQHLHGTLKSLMAEAQRMGFSMRLITPAAPGTPARLVTSNPGEVAGWASIFGAHPGRGDEAPLALSWKGPHDRI